MGMAAPRRLLVTGAAGFVGRHLLPVLHAEFTDAAVVPATFDLRDEAGMAEQIAAVRPDACIHLAAVSAVSTAQADPATAWDINLHGTLRLARLLAEAAPGCTLLFASTADAYGRSFAAEAPLDESAALNPINVYGATKAAADLALGAMVADERLRVIRARPFNHTGPGQSHAFVVAAFARQIARVAAGLQPPVVQVGALDPVRDFLDVRDVCAAYARCLRYAGEIESGTVLNIASGQGRRIEDVLRQLLAEAHVTVRLEVDAKRLRRSEIACAIGHSGRAAEVLGWAPAIPWAQTLADVLDDWRVRVTGEQG